MILILSNKWDISVDFVVAELRKRNHTFLRLNTEDLINNTATIKLPNFQIVVTKQGKKYNLCEDVKVIWNRRPGKPYDDVSPENRPSFATQRFVNDQWYSWLESLQLIKNATWVNHPNSNDAMESKVRQLFLASRKGFPIPETVITNDPNEARQFLNDHDGKIIAKALYSPLIEEPEQDFFVFTNEIDQISPVNDEQIKISPSIFQKPMLPKTDYRVTVIKDKIIAAKIEVEQMSEQSLDWRTQKDGLKFVQCELPKHVERFCCEYVAENGLIFGAIDLVQVGNEFIFIEINPNGEWGWLQKPNGLPIAESLCDFMISQDIGE